MQPKEKKKKEKKKNTPLSCAQSPAQPDFTPSYVHFLNKPETVMQSEGEGECRRRSS